MALHRISVLTLRGALIGELKVGDPCTAHSIAEKAFRYTLSLTIFFLQKVLKDFNTQ